MVGDAIAESGWLITVEDANDRSALRLWLEPTKKMVFGLEQGERTYLDRISKGKRVESLSLKMTILKC